MGKLPDDATITRLYLTEKLGTHKIAAKYDTDHGSVAYRLRKMGIPSNLHQNWGGRRKWKPKGPHRKLCLLCITPVPEGKFSSHLRETHGITKVWTDTFFINADELPDKYGQNPNV